MSAPVEVPNLADAVEQLEDADIATTHLTVLFGMLSDLLGEAHSSNREDRFYLLIASGDHLTRKINEQMERAVPVARQANAFMSGMIDGLRLRKPKKAVAK